MVFEGILVEILNTFLGDYIENLDKEQLSLAVWSGKPWLPSGYSVTEHCS